MEKFDELVTYDPVTGSIVWKPRPESMFPTPASARTWNTRFAGVEAGTVERKGNTSYRRLNLKGSLIYAHQVAAWFIFGSIPDCVDHKDGNGLNNAADNLRQSSFTLNARNREILRRNRSGVTGVHCDARTSVWVVQCRNSHEKHTITLYRGYDFLEAVSRRKSWELLNGYTTRTQQESQ